MIAHPLSALDRDPAALAPPIREDDEAGDMDALIDDIADGDVGRIDDTFDADDIADGDVGLIDDFADGDVGFIDGIADDDVGRIDDIADDIGDGDIGGDVDADADASGADPIWAQCRFLTCSVLPVRIACNLACPFCFSRSSVSALKAERRDWSDMDVEGYFAFSRARGASRLVITGGGEPLLAPDVVLDLVRRARPFFDEIACFTNGSALTPALAEALGRAGLSYLCYSRHAAEDDDATRLMGRGTPTLARFFEAVEGLGGPKLKVRATCVMTRGAVDSRATVWQYIEKLRAFGVEEFTFKHTYTAYPGSVFQGSGQDRWARDHQIELDPFEDQGQIVGRLPWGPVVRRIEGVQVCHYREPTPAWEKAHRIGRSLNLLSDGSVFASLEERQSLLYRLSGSSTPSSAAAGSRASGP